MGIFGGRSKQGGGNGSQDLEARRRKNGEFGNKHQSSPGANVLAAAAQQDRMRQFELDRQAQQARNAGDAATVPSEPMPRRDNPPADTFRLMNGDVRRHLEGQGKDADLVAQRMANDPRDVDYDVEGRPVTRGGQWMPQHDPQRHGVARTPAVLDGANGSNRTAEAHPDAPRRERKVGSDSMNQAIYDRYMDPRRNDPVDPRRAG